MATSNTLDKLKRKKAFELANSGNIQASIDIYQQLHRKNPRDANAAFMLGALYGSIGNNIEAERFSLRATELDSSLVDAYYNLALAEKNLGNLDAAIDALRHVVAASPDHVEALNNLGHSLMAKNEHSQAFEFLRRALRIKPSHVESLVNLGRLYLAQGKFALAVTALNEAMSHSPDSFEISKLLAHAHYQNGDNDSAISLYQKTIDANKDDVEAISGMAMAFEKARRFDEALRLIEPYLKDKYLESVALAFSKVARHFDREVEAIAYIEKTIARSDAEDNKTLHFQLGRLYDACREYDKAFTHYQESNKVQTNKANIDENINLMEAMQHAYTPEMFMLAPRSRIYTKCPIFIVGMPRSGTTLIEQILASHTAVSGGGELSDIDDISNNLPTLLRSKNSYPECVSELTQDVIDRISQQYLNKLSEISATSPHVTDKMPHNFLHLGLISQMFPEAPIIYCRREPLDNCLSIYFSEFNSMHSYSSDLTAIGEHYVCHIRLMTHWKELLGDKILELNYEDMVNNQEVTTRRLLEFCGLEWDENCLHFYKSKRTANTISYDQVRRPIYKKSVARWKNYEKHLGPLIKALDINTSN